MVPVLTPWSPIKKPLKSNIPKTGQPALNKQCHKNNKRKDISVEKFYTFEPQP